MNRRSASLALLFALCADASAADASGWRPWLELRPAAVAAPHFPADAALRALGSDRAWVERWAAVVPSVAWNDIVAELVVRYQQNPLRAARAYTYVHTAIHDALVACERRGCEVSVQRVAMHAAASRVLDHLYTGEASGRLEALGYSAATAVLAALGGHGQAALAWQAGREVAETARQALADRLLTSDCSLRNSALGTPTLGRSIDAVKVEHHAY